MRFSQLLAIPIVFLSLACCASAQQDQQKNPNDFYSFWKEFRSAILNRDDKKIVSLTRFPFEVKGADDTTPLVYHDEDGFRRTINDILDQPIFQMRGGQLIQKSMRDVIETKTDILSSDLITEELARVELFSFIKENHQWRFYRAYFEE